MKGFGQLFSKDGCSLKNLVHIKGHNYEENLGAATPMVGRIFPPLIGIGLRYLKIRTGRPCGYVIL